MKVFIPLQIDIYLLFSYSLQWGGREIRNLYTKNLSQIGTILGEVNGEFQSVGNKPLFF